MAHDVFISHSAKDKSTADMVCALLETEGIRCWIAPRDILPGIDWGEAIVDAIENCRIMVLILSSNANTSMQIKREVERAVHNEKTIIPFRIEQVTPSKSLEYFISTSHWLDAFSTPLERHITRLRETIQCMLSKPQMTAAAVSPAPAETSEHPADRKRTVSKLRLVILTAGFFAAAAFFLVAMSLYRHLSTVDEQLLLSRTPDSTSRTQESSQISNAFPQAAQSEASWSQIIDKARRLRALGKINEALAVYSNYRDRFQDTYPSTKQYIKTVQSFTLQNAELGISGGVYIYEIMEGGTADRRGLSVGDVIFAYNGYPVNSTQSYISTWKQAIKGANVRIDFLRMDTTGHFHKHHFIVPHDLLGVSIMDF